MSNYAKKDFQYMNYINPARQQQVKHNLSTKIQMLCITLVAIEV